MPDHEAMTASGKPPVGDQCDLLPQTLAHDGGRWTQHFAHSGAAFRSLVADDHHVAGLHFAAQDSLQGGFFGIEYSRLAVEAQPLLPGDLCNGTLRREVSV